MGGGRPGPERAASSRTWSGLGVDASLGTPGNEDALGKVSVGAVVVVVEEVDEDEDEDEDADDVDDGDIINVVAAAPRSGSSSPSSAAGTANARAAEAVAGLGGMLMTSPGRRSSGRATSAGLARTSASGSTPRRRAMSVRVSPSRTSCVAGPRGSDERGMTTRARGGAERGSAGGREGAERASRVRARLGRDEAWPRLGSRARATRRSVPRARDDEERRAGRRRARLGVLARAASGERARGVPWCGARGRRHRERGAFGWQLAGGLGRDLKIEAHITRGCSATGPIPSIFFSVGRPRASCFSPRERKPQADAIRSPSIHRAPHALDASCQQKWLRVRIPHLATTSASPRAGLRPPSSRRTIASPPPGFHLAMRRAPS